MAASYSPIERARRKGRLKRGAEWERVSVEALDVAVATDDNTLLSVPKTLNKLAEIRIVPPRVRMCRATSTIAACRCTRDIPVAARSSDSEIDKATLRPLSEPASAVDGVTKVRSANSR